VTLIEMAILHVRDIEVANAQPPPKSVHTVRSAPPAGRTCLTTLPQCAAQAGSADPQPTRSMLSIAGARRTRSRALAFGAKPVARDPHLRRRRARDPKRV
jgi:hypothetical protein